MTSIQIDRTDGLSSATAIKGPVRVATTANITLSGEQTIDGVAVVTDDRVLVKDQTTASENGIYIVDTGAWRRAKDFAGNRDIKKGTLIRVTEGTSYANTIYSVSASNPITVGTTSITFAAVDSSTLAIDWSGGTSGAPTLSIPNIMQRRYVDVGAYASLTDTNDAHAAIQAAFTAGSGREIVFTNPYGGTRYYRSLTRPSGVGQTTGVLTMPNKARIIMEPGALLDFSDWANSGNAKYYLNAEATAPTAVNLASNATIDTNSIVLTDGSSFAEGDDIIIVSDAFFTTEDGSTGTKGEWAFVTAVSSNTLTIAGKLRDTYNTADTARVYRMSDLCELTLEGINLLGCGKFTTAVVGDRGIRIVNGKNCHIIGGSVAYSDQNTIQMVNVLNGSVTGTSFRFGPKVDVNQYGPHFINLCENVHFRNVDVIGGKEASGLSATGGIQGPTRDCSISYSRFRGAWRSGCATHDNHTGFEFSHNVVEDCEQGVDNRIIGGTIKSNIFRRLGADTGSLSCALQLGSGAQKVLFEGNTVEDALRGVLMPASIVHEVAPGDIDIIDNDMRQMGAYGVLIENTTGSTAACGTVTVKGNRFEGDSSTAMRGVEIEGKWKPVVVGNTMRNGNAGRSIFLHATANGTGTNGPVDPVVTDNVYDSTFTVPLIQHASGITKDFRNTQIGAWTSGDRLRGSKTHDFASIAGSFGAFESTTVTVTGAALGDEARAWINLATGGIFLDARVTATDTVTVWAVNFTTGAIDLASATLTVEVIKA